ncbi:TlpA disulfide reductase family protein [Pedobacter sp. BAL39]|uniref:TlpA family protein disulfide reductase n=1 Tax=Pedobacter sp. BAL39 TaxID=391596 RepID=UPI000A0209B6|nr:TlpA disulfide reductase family protein [Pedobacter sp. BAL39]
MKIILLLSLAMFSLTSYVHAQSNVAPEKSISLGGLQIGTKAPDLQAKEWLSEKPDTKGKFVALDFWGTSCKPCISGFAHVNELHRKHKDQIAFIAATTDEAPEETYAFNSPVIEFSSMMQKPKVWKDFNIQGIPHMIIIDPKGIVRFS